MMRLAFSFQAAACRANGRCLTQKGFTLIELLIAITLMAVLAGLSWRGIDGLMRTREVTQTRVTQVAVVQTVLAQWQADLDALQTSGVSVSGLQWDGRVLRMVRRASNLRTDGSDPGLWVVGWTRRAVGNADNSSGQWVRWQSPNLQDATQLREAWAQAEQWGQNPSSNDAVRETPLIPLLQWQITYFRGNAWTNPLSSADGKTNDASSAELPDAIRLQVDLPSSTGVNGRLTLDWVRPNFSNIKS
jgi:general secretion pathway protein J